mmetsp:Transcript_21991/g.34143  ORF Transcript_21991/g.34143 Transcript_21991/m.34143 type:complete len:155 (+) Transcript_21991:420-884(+)
MKTESRRDQWVEQFRTNPKALNSMMSGSQDTAHPTMFSFRDKSDKANIYVRSYLTSSDRASLQQFRAKQGMLKKMLYKQDDPLRKYFLRPKQDTLEQRTRLRFQPSSTSERVQEEIHSQHTVDFDHFDLKLYKNPVYKKKQKELWRTKNGFSIK